MFTLFNFPTCLTFIRIALAPCIMIAIFSSLWIVAFSLFCIAMATDFFDGYVARVYGQETEFGKLLDPVADKILLFFTLWALYKKIGSNILPAWFVMFLLIKDCILLVGGAFLVWYKSYKVISPSFFAKLITALFMLFCLYLIYSNYMGFSQVYVSSCIYFFTGAVVIILLDYAYKFIMLLKK